MKTILFILTFLLCENGYAQTTPSSKVFKPVEVYQSDNLIVIQVSENAFVHTSYLQTNDFGNVPCNGMIVRNSNEAIHIKHTSIQLMNFHSIRIELNR